MNIKAIAFTMYKVSDLQKAISFYKDTLGLTLKSQGEGWAELWAGNDAIVLGTWDFAANAKCNVSVGFDIDDIKASRAELESKGVKFDGDNWDTPVCIGATFFDLDGNKISIHQKK